IAGLQLTGGSIVLFPDFQAGGAITNLTLDGAALDGTNVVTGQLHWSSGTLNGALTVASTGSLLLESSAFKTWNAAVTNLGTIQVVGTGDAYLYGNSGARIENQGLMDLTGAQSFYGYNTPPVHNTGTVRKSGGTGTARLGVASSYPLALDNSGLIQSQS